MEELLKIAKELNIKVNDEMSYEDIKKLIEEKLELLKQEQQKQNYDSVITNSMMNSMMM